MMLANLSGWHLMIIIVVWLVPAAIISIIAFVIVTMVRRRRQQNAAAFDAASPVGAVPVAAGTGELGAADAPPVNVRLREVDQLRVKKLITEDEYRAKRDEILRGL